MPKSSYTKISMVNNKHFQDVKSKLSFSCYESEVEELTNIFTIAVFRSYDYQNFLNNSESLLTQ